MPDADLYLETIDYTRYLSDHECTKCGAESCRQLVERLRHQGDGAFESLEGLAEAKARALQSVIEVEHALPSVPQITDPRPFPPELAEFNSPAPGDPVLVTGNSVFTQEVLLAILSNTVSPFFVLFSDTRGDTLDMALIFDSFTTARLVQSLAEERVAERAYGSTLILPGLAVELWEEIADITGFPTGIGPVCAAELPLYFGDRWIAARQ
jgi:CO dehydrogenase/acetyl-CoA synthase gamma subunit (corrinoid Fe-S protein)